MSSVGVVRSADGSAVAPPPDSAGAGSASRDDFGLWRGLNLLQDDAEVAASARRAATSGGRLVTWSGWFAGDEEDETSAAMRTHGQDGHRRLSEVVEGSAGVLRGHGVQLCLRPRAEHVLSDAPSCLTFLRSGAGEMVRLVLDPMAMMTASMMPRAEEHVGRVLSALAGHPSVAAVMVANARVAGGRVVPIGLHRGDDAVMDSRRLIAMVSEHVRPELDWIVLEDDVVKQREMLRMYGPGE